MSQLPDVVLTLLEQIHRDVKSVRGELQLHMAEEESMLRLYGDSIAAIKKAFPLVDGEPDFAGHKSAHQTEIDSYRARKEFRQKMTYELAKWGLIGFALWTLKAILEHAAHTLITFLPHS